MRLIYFDTNIVLDILDTKRDNHHKIRSLLQKVIENNVKIVISEDSLTTIYYIAREKQNVLDFFQVILEEAGGTFTDWRGTPTIHAHESIATNNVLLDQVMAAVNKD